MRLGIDFGTTNTVVSLSDRGSYPIVSFFDGQGDAHDFFPTVLAMADQRPCYGFEALELARASGVPLTRSFKRWLGRADAAPEQPAAGESGLSLQDVATGFLLALREAIVNRSSVSKLYSANEELEVAIAAPANSHSAQRFITLEGFRRAGFKVCLMLNEPSACGVEYAQRYERTVTSKRDSVLVYDLGGGTFDVSLVFIQGGQHEIQASTGIARLGGDDFDDVLVDLALADVNLSKQELSPESLARLALHCRQVKETVKPNTRRLFAEVGVCLSNDERAVLGRREDLVASISADAYEAACAPLVHRTLDEVERVLGDHESELAGLYVVGGGTSLPLVGRILRERFPRRVHKSPQPSASAAIGLAIALDPDSKTGVQERLNRHFGVFREAEGGGRVEFDTILDSSFKLPQANTGTHSVRRSYRPAHNIGHLRFIECTTVEADGTPSGDITSFAELRFPYDSKLQTAAVNLQKLPVLRAIDGEHTIEEDYSVDNSGIVTLRLADLNTGYQEVHRFG